MARRPFFPHVLRALVLALVTALVAAACSSGDAGDTSTGAPTAAPSTSTSTTSTSSTTTTTLPPTLTLRGDIPDGLKARAEQVYDHLIDPANPAPAMPAALLAYAERHRVEPGERTGEGAVSTLANGDRVGVVTSQGDWMVFVDPAGEQKKWRMAAARLGDRRPWLGADGPRHVLVLGSDARVGEDQLNLRADSIHILALRPKQGDGVLVGFPRDSWIWGSKLTDLMPGRGPDGMVEVIEDTTGLEMGGWLAVGFEGFLGLIGELGDLEIDLPTAMPSGNTWDDYPAGPQVLDPTHALRLARVRKELPNGDLDRSVNQGRIILAALAMVRDRGILYLPEWVAAYSRHGFTDLRTDDIVMLAATAHSTAPRNIDNVVVPGSFGWVGAASVVFLGDAAEDIYADLRDGILGNG